MRVSAPFSGIAIAPRSALPMPSFAVGPSSRKPRRCNAPILSAPKPCTPTCVADSAVSPSPDAPRIAKSSTSSVATSMLCATSASRRAPAALEPGALAASAIAVESGRPATPVAVIEPTSMPALCAAFATVSFSSTSLSKSGFSVSEESRRRVRATCATWARSILAASIGPVARFAASCPAMRASDVFAAVAADALPATTLASAT